MSADCAWCRAPRGTGSTCARCGADYVKAETIRRFGRAGIALDSRAREPRFEVMVGPDPDVIEAIPAPRPDVADSVRELRMCIVAIPLMLLICLALGASPMGHFLRRTLFAMPLHESGHAMMAWLTGHFAIPTLWRTMSFDRGILIPLLLLGVAAGAVLRGWQTRDTLLLRTGVLFALVVAAAGLLVSDDTAAMLVVFAGDAGGMVLATLMMASFFCGRNTQLYRGNLRWGFVGIGAGAYVEIVSVWLSARQDRANLPFGEIEGVGLSDALRLSTQWGWSDTALVNRHLAVAIVCFVALAVVYARGVQRAAQAARTPVASGSAPQSRAPMRTRPRTGRA